MDVDSEFAARKVGGHHGHECLNCVIRERVTRILLHCHVDVISDPGSRLVSFRVLPCQYLRFAMGWLLGRFSSDMLTLFGQ